MYYLIESLDQLKNFYNIGYEEAFIDVISFNDKIHPTLNHISLVYIHPILSPKGFILGVDHSETLNEISPHIHAILNTFKVLYCRDKKEILHYFPLKHIYDISLPPHPYIRSYTITHELFYRNHGDNPHINKIIPVGKHYEMCEKTFNDLKPNIDKVNTPYSQFFNNKSTIVFNAIERNGIFINKPTFESYFHPTDSNFIYTQYNLKTTTTRPSNHFNGVNYAALNKENGCRKSFIPRNDKFIEIDITAYHPTLAAKLINYNFPTEDIHGHFAELYKVGYAKAKELTFKQLYGGVFDNYKEIEFFKRIETYVSNNWEMYNNLGKVIVPISGYCLEKDKLDNMNPQKLFNYLLQGYETAQNVLILWDMLRILRGKNTKLVLYTYDSYLLDVDDNESDVLEEIREIFKKYKLNTKEIEGYDYDFRRNI
jgi:hypothetical protein